MKAVVAAFNQEKALVGAFSVITNLRMELFEALLYTTEGLRKGQCTDGLGPQPTFPKRGLGVKLLLEKTVFTVKITHRL